MPVNRGIGCVEFGKDSELKLCNMHKNNQIKLDVLHIYMNFKSWYDCFNQGLRESLEEKR